MLCMLYVSFDMLNVKLSIKIHHRRLRELAVLLPLPVSILSSLSFYNSYDKEKRLDRAFHKHCQVGAVDHSFRALPECESISSYTSMTFIEAE